MQNGVRAATIIFPNKLLNQQGLAALVAADAAHGAEPASECIPAEDQAGAQYKKLPRHIAVKQLRQAGELPQHQSAQQQDVNGIFAGADGTEIDEIGRFG